MISKTTSNLATNILNNRGRDKVPHRERQMDHSQQRQDLADEYSGPQEMCEMDTADSKIRVAQYSKNRNSDSKFQMEESKVRAVSSV